MSIESQVVECDECKKPFMIFRGLACSSQPCPYCGADYDTKIEEGDKNK